MFFNLYSEFIDLPADGMHRLERFKNSMTSPSEFTREWFNLARTTGSAMEHDSTRGCVTVLAKILPDLVHSLIVI